MSAERLAAGGSVVMAVDQSERKASVRAAVLSFACAVTLVGNELACRASESPGGVGPTGGSAANGVVGAGTGGGAAPSGGGTGASPATSAGHGASGVASINAATGGQGGLSSGGGSGMIASHAGAQSATGGVAPGSSGSGSSVGGAAGASAPMTYPMLDGAAIGTPTMVASGFSLAESPLWDPCNHRLMFADVSAAGGGAIKTLTPDGMVSTLVMGTGNTNGMGYDIDGSLILAQMGSKHIARRDASGMITVIDGNATNLHTPDDLVVRSDGTVYFSDGDFCPIGTLLGFASQLPVYSIKPGAAMLINNGTVSGPNGIELSPDEKLLYVNGYGDGNIYVYDVATDGALTKRAQPLVTGLTDPDSMCLDAAGNIYVAVSTGIQVLRPDGSKVKLIPITAPAGSCTKAGMTNCTFGGDDGKTFYVTTWTTIQKIENMPIPGLDWIVGKQRAKCM